MEFVSARDTTAGVDALAQKITANLREREVLWLVCGGSAIPAAVAVMRIVRAASDSTQLENLTVALTDERYGSVGHADSNWQQLVEAGFDFRGISTIPCLIGEALESTVAHYEAELTKILETHPTVIGQFGIGADGHIAGVLPHTPGVSDTHLVCGYEAGPYVRITLTLSSFKYLSAAYVFVFGDSKREAVFKLRNEEIPIEEMPSQILKQIPEAYLFSDQL